MVTVLPQDATWWPPRPRRYDAFPHESRSILATVWTYVDDEPRTWRLAMRIGSVLGSVGGGAMLSMNMSLPTVFLVVGIPAMIAGVTLFALGRQRTAHGLRLALAV